MTQQSGKNPGKTTRPRQGKFVNDQYLGGYTKPRMVEVAQEMLCREELSEEGFLGAQGVLLLNGFL